MDFLEVYGSQDLILSANELRKDFHRLRDEYKAMSEGYYRQSTASNYYTEDALINKLNALKSIKAEYLRICDILKERGYRHDYGGWHSSNNYLYAEKRDILHSA